MRKVAFVIAVVIAACPWASTLAQQAEDPNETLRIANLAIRTYQARHMGKLPMKIEDAAVFVEDKKFVEKFHKHFMVHPDGMKAVGVERDVRKRAGFVVVYHKDAAKIGGLVMLGDGAITKLTAKELEEMLKKK